MKNYYEILEITKTASEIDIKRAYFKSVKVNRPEDDPEAFKLVRLAYETLMNVEERKKYDESLDVPDDIAPELLQVNYLIDNHKYKEAIERLKPLIVTYPESPEFEYALGKAYLSANSAGNAVKQLEQAAKKHSGNAKIQTILAEAYDQRGWNNKAREQYQHAVSVDNKSAFAWASYIWYCNREFRFSVSYVFSEAMAVDEEIFVDNEYQLYHLVISSLLYSNFYSFNSGLEGLPEGIPKYFALYFEGLKRVKGRINEDSYRTFMSLAHLFSSNEETVELAVLALPYLDEGSHYDDDAIEANAATKENILFIKFQQDEKISEILQGLIGFSSCECGNPNCYSKGQELIMKGILLEDVDKYKEDIIYFKENYPLLYQTQEKFLNDLLNPMQLHSMIATNKRQTMQFMKRNPEFADEMMDDDEDGVWLPPVQPIVRQEPKVGRNDPCPCGSGKKYKKCCG